MRWRLLVGLLGLQALTLGWTGHAAELRGAKSVDLVHRYVDECRASVLRQPPAILPPNTAPAVPAR